MADFFVLTRDDEFRRLAIQQELQDHLSAVFEGASAFLRDHELEAVPFGQFAFQPDETEVWTIADFTLPEHLQLAIDDPITCPALAVGEVTDPGLKAVAASFPEVGFVAFQVLDRRKVLAPHGLSMILDAGVFRRLEEPGLQLGDSVDVVVEANTLRFRSAHQARRVFDISAFYVEATDAQVDQWIGRAEIVIEGDIEAYRTAISQWERKRIGFILSSGILDSVPVSVIRERAEDYELDLAIELDGGHERLVIPQNATERRELIKFLEEDYYKGPLSEQAFVANSKRPLGNAGA